MKTLVIDQPNSVSFGSKQKPTVRDGEVLLQIRRLGFCGSDLTTFRGQNPLVSYPRIPGHEIGATMKSRRLATALLLAFSSAFCLGAKDATQPNILFILSDDQSWEALGCLGGEVHTPNLDRLAARGTVFPRAYNMGSWVGAVCIASRTMFNTGRSLWHCRDLESSIRSYENNVKRGETTEARPDPGTAWSQWLASAGYRTYFAGKWHTHVHSVQDLFDVMKTVRGGMPNDTPEGYNRPLNEKDHNWLPWDTSKGGHWKGGKHWSEVLGDEGIGIIREAAARPEPFFIYLAFSAPHDPRQSPKEFVDMYPIENVKVPANFLPDHPHRLDIGLPDGQRDERLAPHPRTEYSVKVHRQEYYAIISHLDAQVGRILDALGKSGKADNTCVFFTSDHGLAAGHHGLMGKQNMYEHSLRAPLIAAGPGIKAGKRNETRVYIQDIVPTTLELAGARSPANMEFQSLMPMLTGESSQGRQTIYAAYFGFQRTAIVGDWKIIHFPPINVFQLFNLRDDPDEMHDLSASPAHGGKLESMKAKLTAAMEAHDDPLIAGEDMTPQSANQL